MVNQLNIQQYKNIIRLVNISVKGIARFCSLYLEIYIMKLILLIAICFCLGCTSSKVEHFVIMSDIEWKIIGANESHLYTLNTVDLKCPKGCK